MLGGFSLNDRNFYVAITKLTNTLTTSPKITKPSFSKAISVICRCCKSRFFNQNSHAVCISDLAWHLVVGTLPLPLNGRLCESANLLTLLGYLLGEHQNHNHRQFYVT